MSSDPAEIRYASNEAPFVVFDVSPRNLDTRHQNVVAEAALTFVATDALSHVDVFAYASSPRDGVHETWRRIACGSYIAGYYRCAVPTAQALAWLQGGDGLFGLRIEAEGVEGDRSTVHVVLPVKGAALPVASRLSTAP